MNTPGATSGKRLLLLLSLVNIVNYLDRQLIFALFPIIKTEFSATDFQLGLLGTIFMLAHAAATVPFGILSDRWSRSKLITLGMVFWSFCTFISGFTQRLHHLIVARGFIGVGGATFDPAAVSLVAEKFGDASRGRALGIMKTGMWIGGMLGLMVGGVLGTIIGWRYTLFLAALPGFALAFFTWNLGGKPRQQIRLKQKRARIFDWNPVSILITIGGMFANFSAGAFIAWIITFIVRYNYFNLSIAAPFVGGIALFSGLAGVLVGSSLADKLYQKTPTGRLLTVTAGMLLSTPFIPLAVYAPSPTILLAAIALGIFFMSWYHGPIMAVLMDTVVPSTRGAMAGAYIFFIHIFGDMPAPAMIGKISDLFDLRIGLMTTVIGNILCAIFFFAAITAVKKSIKKA